MFWNIFSSLCEKNKKTPTGVITELNISRGSVTHWKSGKVPQHTTLLKISNYFGVSVDYLLGKDTSVPTQDNIDNNDEKRELLNRIARMDEGQLKQLSDFADYLIDKKK